MDPRRGGPAHEALRDVSALDGHPSALIPRPPRGVSPAGGPAVPAPASRANGAGEAARAEARTTPGHPGPGLAHPPPIARRTSGEEYTMLVVTAPSPAMRPVSSSRWRIERAATLSRKQSSPVT